MPYQVNDYCPFATASQRPCSLGCTLSGLNKVQGFIFGARSRCSDHCELRSRLLGMRFAFVGLHGTHAEEILGDLAPAGKLVAVLAGFILRPAPPGNILPETGQRGAWEEYRP